MNCTAWAPCPHHDDCVCYNTKPAFRSFRYNVLPIHMHASHAGRVLQHQASLSLLRGHLGAMHSRVVCMQALEAQRCACKPLCVLVPYQVIIQRILLTLQTQAQSTSRLSAKSKHLKVIRNMQNTSTRTAVIDWLKLI
jgi:hypothetical protein